MKDKHDKSTQDLFSEYLPHRACSPELLKLVRRFGKRVVSEDDGITCTMYLCNGKIYIVDIEDKLEEQQ